MVVRTGDQFLDSSNGKCHPTFIPKHSKLVKFLGGIAHIVVLGFAGVHQKRTGKRTWPGFFNSEEICANCKKEPGSTGCMNAEDDQYEGQFVQHSSNVRSMFIDDSKWTCSRCTC